MTGGDDSFIVLKHVYNTRRPGDRFDAEVYRRVRRECRALLQDPQWAVKVHEGRTGELMDFDRSAMMSLS